MNNTTNNIAIIGAGIMGLCTAYALQKPGATITLYDAAGFPAKNASYIAGGMLAPYSEIDHTGEEFLPAGFASIDLWEEINTALGNTIEFQRSQSIIIAHPEDRHSLERFKSYLPQDDQNITQEPFKEFTNAITLKGEASLHPAKTMQAMCEYLKTRITFKQENVNPQEIAKKFDLIIDCRGMGAKNNLSDLGHHLRGVKGEIVVVRNPDFSLPCPVRLMHPRYPLYIVPRGCHHFMIGASIIESSESKNASLQSTMELMSALYSLHSSFGDAEVIDIAADIRPSFDNNLPQIITNENIMHANGLYRHGYLMAPIMAEIIANQLAGKTHPYAHLFMKGADNDSNHNQRRSQIISAAA